MALDDNTTEYNRLEELGGSDYEVVDGQPNIKGWDVKNAQGQSIGDVEELLFNPASRKVRYMIVDTDANDLSLEARKVLIPIGVAELHENDDDVIVPNITVEQLNNLPTYDGSQLSADTERSIVNTFEGFGVAGFAAGAYTNDNNDFYNHEHFNQNRLYNRRNPITETNTDNVDRTIPIIEENLDISKREVETGGTRVTSTIVEKPVEETVNLREEHVHIERTPVDRPVTGSDFDTFKEGQIELTEHAEVPVVSKEARVVEEVNITKDVDEREETIRDTVRSTEVEAERIEREKNRRNDELL
jgi:stress response protein YsnF